MPINEIDFKTIIVEHKNNVLYIKLNRPEKKHAINPAMTNELLYVLDFAANEESVRVLELSSQGNIFCAGGDLRTMAGEENEDIPNMDGNLADVIKKLRGLFKPTVCRIEGDVYAGALLLVCNSTHAYARENVTFTAPEIKRGIWPFMVMAGLFRVMPKRQGLDFIMRGNSINALQAKETGLVTEVLNEKDFYSKVNSIVAELAGLPPKAMQRGLKAHAQQEFNDFEASMEFLENEINESLQTDEAIEGITAFLEKREPNWK